MERRSFLKTGAAAGVWGLAALPFAPAQVAATRPRPRPADPIRLSSNENPLGISPAAREAIVRGLVDANRYPGASRTPLMEALVRRLDIEENQLVLGAGSTEVLQMAVQAFAAPGTRFVIPDPTFEDVPRYAEPYPVELVKVPLKADGAHDLERMRDEAERGSDPALVYVCNPNNPTGTLTPSAAVDEWIASSPERVTFLVDEAYVDYADDANYWSALRWIDERPNVIVVRTFSKVYGMAGLRLGYGAAHAETAARLEALQSNNSANHVALVAARASLDDADFVRRSLDVNRQGRRLLYECLAELGLEHFPSHTNFVMHEIDGDLDSYIERMRERGIRVGRPFPPYLGYNRVSIGLPAEMERFVTELRAFRTRGWV